MRQSIDRCSSTVVQTIEAPLPLVWSILRRFDNPMAYKQFIESCTIQAGDGGKGSVRHVAVISGLPARFSTERLDELDEDAHVITVSVIGGDHRLINYRSTTRLVEAEEGAKTVVVESYVVDVPEGNTKDDLTTFANLIVGCNLRSLAKVTEKMAVAGFR